MMDVMVCLKTPSMKKMFALHLAAVWACVPMMASAARNHGLCLPLMAALLFSSALMRWALSAQAGVKSSAMS